ncbi:MAG: hypothetical protein IBX71_01030 [Candidatus Desulforudis sp.]|nr:hypothetical protein [Desulforudis sp.]
MAQITPHSRPVELAYRSGFTLQALGLLALVISPDASRLDSAWSVIGYVLISAGVLISGWLLQVYMPEVRLIVLAGAVIGCLLQAAGAMGAGGYLIPLGLGFVFVGSCGLVGKEAYCFRFREGWYLMPVLALLTVALLVQNTLDHPMPVTSVLLILATALLFSFTIRKYKMPFYGKCGGND